MLLINYISIHSIRKYVIKVTYYALYYAFLFLVAENLTNIKFTNQLILEQNDYIINYVTSI